MKSIAFFTNIKSNISLKIFKMITLWIEIQEMKIFRPLHPKRSPKQKIKNLLWSSKIGWNSNENGNQDHQSFPLINMLSRHFLVSELMFSRFLF
jgi:hypothetical protein